MERPDDIPKDVWDAAVDVARTWYHEEWEPTEYIQRTLVEGIARAIMAERESCARIADAHSECERDCGDVIAAAIRAGGQPTHHEIRDLSTFVAERNAGKE